MKLSIACLLAGLIALGSFQRTLADGTEGLGVPSIPIATGTGIAAGGRGLIHQPDVITVTVPAGAAIKQVLLYWEGFMLTDTVGDNTIRVSNGGPPVMVTGNLIGGPSFFFYFAWASTFRADITSLGLITPGVNNLTIDDMSFTEANNGAGVLVIYDDGGPPTQIDVRDGNDLAFINFPAPRKDTIPQTFTFTAAPSDRVARLDMFAASVAGVTSTGGPQRPNVIEITVGGVTTAYNNLMDSFAGEEWDYVSLPVNVPAGITSVKVQIFSRDDLGLNEIPASLDWLTAFFVIEAPAHIGDLVFHDLNANGIQDGGGEVGVDGVTVELFTCGGNALTGTTVTAGGGLYGFDVLPDDYYVKFSNLPAGFAFSPSTPSGASDPTDSDANPLTGITDCTSINSGENDPTWDAGIYQPPQTARIGDLVFNDLNANGIQDGGGEVGVDGVTVQLFNCVGDALVATTVTAGGGLYLFTVPPGNYYVKFSNLPAGFVFSPSTPSGVSDPTDSDANPATGVADCTTLVAGETDVTWDAGVYQPARIGDLVFNDLNANGIQDGGGEVGVDGVTVELYNCVGDVLVATTVTAGGGLYLFTVPPGNYYVKFSNLPAGFVFSPSTPSGFSDPTDSDANPATGVADCTTLVAGETDVTWDAGVYQPARIGDLVFNDLNANGIQDGGGEVGVDGVTVELYNCVGDVLVATTVTAGGGLYVFTVPPGNYYVKFSNLPAGFVFSPSTPGPASDPNDSDANPATGVADCTTLVANETDLTWDAGIYQPARIGDLVFNDLNANGIQDGGGEVGINGVTVELYNCVGDALVATTVTAGGGLYLFTVPPGDYYVKFSNLPAGFVFSPSTPSGVSDPTDSDANPATGVADCTTLVANETDLTWDAGIYQPARIGDLVFNDLNANGIQDGGGEVGVNGVTVQLFNCVGDALVATTVTAGGGLYVFTVPPGNYYVKFSNLPAGFVFSPSTPSGVSDPTDSDANPATGVADCTTLVANETDLTWDAGVYQPARIGDLVFNDLNANGIQDGGGEVGVNGVTVQLFNCVGDALVATTVTAGGGLYLFTVPPGNYYVKFSNLPAGFVFSPSTPSGVSDPTDSDANPATGVADCTTLVAGETDVTWDAGVYQPARIGDLVFNDLNANGIQDGGGEVGVDGVTVELYNCVGDVLVATTVTAGGGLYLFTVPPGNYYVKFSNLPAGFVFSPSTPGGVSDPTDSDANPATGVADCTTLVAGETDVTWDAGVYQPARIGDLVFNDLNANGIQDGGGEVGVDGVTVELYNCVGDVLVATTVTAGGGLHLFTVPPGNYYVKFSNLPAGFVFSPSTPGGVSDPTDSDANPATGVADCTTLVANETDLTWDAGIYQPPQAARIGDLVFHDLNANGIQDGGGEVGVDGVTVELYDCVGDVMVATTVTAGGGLYLFTVPPGNYYVKFSNLPAGFVFSPSTPNAASDPTDSDANPATGVADCTTLVANETDLTWDAGVYQPARIGDLVFNDLNANGIQDGGGEVGVNGVTVQLFNCVGDALVATTVTASGGLYVFTVPPGNYYVKFSNLPAGFVFSPSTPGPASDPTDSDANPATGVVDCTTLVANETDLTWDAGIYQPARIGDLVFNDLNANGIQDGGGEVGINGVTVELYNCVGDALVATTVTAGGGLYLFTVPPGNYYVKFSNLPAGFVFSPSTPGPASDPNDSDANPATGVADCTTLVANETDLTWDAGVYQPARIGDLVFNDLNANGIQDGGGEVGVNGVTVQLFNCVGDALVATTVTASGGLYVFTVPPGNYYVKFSNLPAGFVFSPSTPGPASDPTDSDANPATGVVDCTTLVANETDLTWDAGIYQPARIGDLVFNDLNANGIQDGGGEVGINGVTVELYNCVGDALVATTVTAGGGLYLFTVPPGNYYVKFSNLPAGFVFSPSTPGPASDPTDSDANPATGVADCTTLVAGETDLTWDAGIYQPARIGDLVFNDLNANGIQDGGGEVGVNGVTVQLFNCVGDALVATTVTASGGVYLFTVPPGNYYVKFSNLPASFVFSPSTPGPASDPTDSDANPATGVADCTTLIAGETDLTWDAGVYQPAKIGDLVFNDLNANGIQDGGGEVGVNGVTVQLFNCVGDALVATTVTAGGGLYLFTVPPGNYYVKFSNLPAGFVFSPSTPGPASDPTDSDANPATGVADCTTLVANETDLTWDAGIYQPPQVARIGDLVFHDLNANGIQDGGGEVGVDGVTVQLFNCVGDVQVATTVTAGGGLYLFTVPPGNYYVKFSNLPAGFVFSPSTPSGVSDPTDSDANPATGVADCTTLVAGETDLTWDAGIYQPARIGDLVFNDLNANGIQDGGGEVGVNGVTVQLFNCIGDALVATTVTASGGVYLFTVPPGNYYVKFSNLPASFVFSPSTPGPASDPTDSDANPATGVADCTTLIAGETDLTWDAGVYQPAKIGDLVFNDLNANGIQDGGGEVGVNGVTVELYNCVGDALVATTVTASGGLYVFTVPPGNYYVKFSNLPAGFVFSPSTPGPASDPTDSDANPATGVADCTTLVANETDVTWDAGIYQPARIGDLAFNDLNANGIQDGGGEVGVNGVTVQLFNCVGDALVATTVTASGGLYVFTVPPGNYYVKFSNLPAGFVFSPSTPGPASDPNDSDANPATGVADCTTLVAGETDLTWDAGIYQPARIGDLVFNDLNANGIQDGGGEVGVNGVTVQLFNCVGDALVATTVTASGGVYLFTVPPGNYYVKFSNLPASFVFSPSTPGPASDPTDSDANPATGVADCTTLIAGETDLTWDAGVYQPAKIGDLVFNDLNANGIQDGGGEVGVNGVTVQLFNCVGDALVATTVTAGGGLYLFTVPPGNYYVKFSNLPAGFAFSPSTPNAASDPTDSDANPATGVADCTTLVAGETDLTWDAGIYQLACIGDLVFNDLNANGNQDGGGEVGVNGVTVQLYHCLNDVLVATTVTAGGGLYSFCVPPGSYYVKFSNLPAGFVFSPSTPGGASDPNDSDANPATGKTDCTDLPPGETDLTWDAGVYQPAKIGDLVFNDLNANGIQDSGGEVGVDGVTVQLFNCVGDVQVATTVTAGGGLYLFTVPPGNYYVKFSNLPAGFVFSPSTPSGVSDPTDSDANPATGVADCTTLVAGETDLTWDAGIYQLACIGDLVFNDLNANGNQDGGGEVGVNGVTVQLYHCLNDVLVATTVTAGGGLYSFCVPPGSYYVKFSNLPAGFVFSPSTPGGASDPNDSDANPATGKTDCTDLPPGETDLTWDAGIYQPAKIGDLVFNDLNANGIQDSGGEVGVDGVTVQLFNCVGDVQVATTVTAGGGLYLFTVPPGDYYVKFSNLPAGFVFSPSTPGSASDPNDSDANPATGAADCTTLTSGETDLTWDAGINQPVTPNPCIELTKVADKSFVLPGGQVTYTYTVRNCGTTTLTDVSVKDDNGTPGYPIDDFVVGTIASLAPGAENTFTKSLVPPTTMCMNVSGVNMVVGTLATQILGNGDVKVIYLQSRNVNDNTYGTGVIGWPGNNHKFMHLTGSDRAGFAFYNTAGTKVLDIEVDYLSAASTAVYPSGYGTLGVTGGDGDVISGSAANVISTMTTLTRAMNNSPFIYTVNSPLPEGSVPTWEYVNGYEVVIKGSAFGASGFERVEIPSIHNSPSKLGFNVIVPTPCDSCVTNLAVVTAKSGATVLTDSDDASVCISQQPPRASIGDFVWDDKNNNGRQDAGEPGVNGVKVELFTCVGNVLAGATTTSNEGRYGFQVNPGDYYVKFSNLPAGYSFSSKNAAGTTAANDSDADPATGRTVCTTLTAGENDVTWDAGINSPVNPDQCLTLTKTASKTTLALFEPVTYSYTVCNCGASPLSNVVITDDNGTPHTTVDDFTVGTIPTLAATACQTLTAQVIPVISTVIPFNNVNVPAGALIVVTTLPTGDIKVTYLQDFGVNDNTYGTGSIGWGGVNGHKFSNLTGSDKLEFRFFAKDGTVPLDLYIDTISAASSVTIPGTGQVITYPSGYGTLGPFGGDGSMVAGNANNIVTFSTSITDNLNDPANLPNKASLIVDSPTSLVGSNIVIDTAKAPGGWDVINSFTVVVKGSTFAAGGGFGSVTVPDQHNSPSKGPKGDITFTNSMVTNTATATAGSLTATAKAVVAVNTQQPSQASIGDFVWDDLNKNSRQDAGEPGVNGVKVELFTCAGNLLVGTTTTSGGGLYGFSVNPGDFYLKFSNLPAGYSFSLKNAAGTIAANDSNADPATGITICTTLAAGENDITWDAGVFSPVSPGQCLTLTKTASKTMVAPFEPVTYTYTACNCGLNPLSNVVISDDNGTPGNPIDDFTVGSIPTLAVGACQSLTAQVIPVISTVMPFNNVNVPAGALIVVTTLPNGNIKVTYLQDFGVNDNTYGTGSIGWGGVNGHKFSNLTGSDKLEFRFFAKDGTVPLDLYIDTISAAPSVTIPGTGQVITYPSGYGTLGPFGGDGSMVAGNINNIVTFSTSISDNLNHPANLPNKAALIVNSPTSLVGGNVVIDPVAAPGGWNHINSFTVVVKGSTFATGGGFDKVTVPDQHNSPSKGPKGAITFTISMVTNTATATAGSLTVTAKAVVAVNPGSGGPGPGGSLPAPWQTSDIGAVGVAGSASYSSTTFTVAGSGKEINGGKDEFRYVYQQANGDCTIVAKVLSLQKTHDEAGAGVMIRETLNDNSKHASLLVTAKKGLHFKSRATTGGSTSKTTASGEVPRWVKVVRSGSTFTASRSTDGVTWTSMGSVSITMGSSVYIGLAVTSHKDDTLTTATFGSATATP